MNPELRDGGPSNLFPKLEECAYTSCYCEENVWKLCEKLKKNNNIRIEEFYAVFVSNDQRLVPLFYQKSAIDEGFSDGKVIWIPYIDASQYLTPNHYEKNVCTSQTWFSSFSEFQLDYHVILVQKGASEVNVFDMDCTLPFPSKFQLYCYFCLGSDQLLDPQFHRMFRVIPAEVYLTSFASDRRHMKKINGSWLKDPPPYEPIRCDSSSHNLDDFTSMKRNEGPGTVMNLSEFVNFFLRNIPPE